MGGHNETLVSQVMDSLDDARAAAGRQAWRDAYAAYAEVDSQELTAADLESYGEAAWWSGKLDEAIAYRERAHAAYIADDDTLGAARMALTLELGLRGSRLLRRRRRLARERRAPAREPAGVAGAWRLLLVHALTAMFAEGDWTTAQMAAFDEAFELARRIGDRDVQMLALSGKGRAFIKSGEIDKGLALLDEATASAMSGDLRAHSAGLVYCITISSCQDLGDVRRAAEWTEAANRWCDKLDVSGLPRRVPDPSRGGAPLAGGLVRGRGAGHCCVRRAPGLRPLDHGERPLRDRRDPAAARRLRRSGGVVPRLERDGTRPAARPLAAATRGGEGRRRRRGDHPQAVRTRPIRFFAFAGSLLRSRSRSPRGISTTARAAADEAEQIVDSYKIGNRRAAAFDATVAFFAAKSHSRRRSGASAIAALRHARDEWQGVGAPYETARARMLLGTAYMRSGDEHAATVELEGALATFERLGARLDEARAKELLGRVEARRTFLFTDIVDSTRLLETLGQEKWKRLLARHNELVREQIAENGGEVVKQTGDGFFASFENPKAAIDAAVGIQRALAGEIVAPDVRIGAHSGGAFRTGTDSADYGGQGVHVASRIGAAAGQARSSSAPRRSTASERPTDSRSRGRRR